MRYLALFLFAALCASPALATELHGSFPPGPQNFLQHPEEMPYSGFNLTRNTDVACGANALQYLVGQTREAALTTLGAGHVRYLHIGIPTDTMHNLNRLNIVVMGKAGDEIISRVYCG